MDAGNIVSIPTAIRSPRPTKLMSTFSGVATSGQTAVILNAGLVSGAPDRILVFVDGIRQRGYTNIPGYDYTTSVPDEIGLTLNFVEPLTAGAVVTAFVVHPGKVELST